MKQHVLVTGAGGFVGRRVCRRLTAAGHQVTAVVRRGFQDSPPDGRMKAVGDATRFSEWPSLLRSVDTVVHLIAKTHDTRAAGRRVVDEFRRVNVGVTRRLVAACQRAGVRRIIYMSSIKAVGDGGLTAYDEATACRPQDAYGVTKFEAERVVVSAANAGGLQWTILRPPLVVGPGARGNIQRMLAWIARGWPWPCPRPGNRRSLVQVDNLADAVLAAAAQPDQGNGLFHVADPQPMSTQEIATHLARGLGRRLHVVPLPSRLLRAAGRLAGRSSEVERIAGDLTVSTDLIRSRLKWNATVSSELGLLRTGAAYLKQSNAAAIATTGKHDDRPPTRLRLQS